MNELKNITRESKRELQEIALSEFKEYLEKAIRYKDFNFIIVPINDKYHYSVEQYLDFLEYYHISIKLS
jgi:hypothetical protein